MRTIITAYIMHLEARRLPDYLGLIEVFKIVRGLSSIKVGLEAFFELDNKIMTIIIRHQ